MTTIPNNKVVVPLQNENIVVPLQGTDTVHPALDPAGEVKLENSQHKCLGDQLGREYQSLQITI